jgi:putative ABC transport system permease protein
VRVSLVDPGFESQDVLTMRLTLPREEYGVDAIPVFFRELTDRLGALPGVVAAAAGSQYPGVAFSFSEIAPEGREQEPGENLPVTLVTTVTRGYFSTLGIPLLNGRTFDETDQSDSPTVVVVNEEAVRRYFDGGDPIGRTLKVGSDPEAPWRRVVGVVGSTRNLALDSEPFPEVFGLHEQVGGVQNQLFLVLRTERAPESLVEPVRMAVREMDPDQPVYAVRTAEETLAAGVAPMRAVALFLTIFAGFALVLAAVGIYSVVSLTVSERTQEIGLRVALGADRGRVRRLVVRQALLPVGIGAVVGALAALAVAGTLQRILFEVTGTDPLTIATVFIVLVGVAALASWVPAFRAARLDPVEALRTE